MATELSFDAEAFLALPLEERVHLCKRLAERAQELADAAAPHYRACYLDIAERWQLLAGEMETFESMEKPKLATKG